jgi:hypothetical protein
LPSRPPGVFTTSLVWTITVSNDDCIAGMNQKKS